MAFFVTIHEPIKVGDLLCLSCGRLIKDHEILSQLLPAEIVVPVTVVYDDVDNLPELITRMRNEDVL